MTSAAHAPAYITAMGKFLPNVAVDNDAIESVLGMVNGRPSRARRITLRNNGILSRHYAIDPRTGLQTHTNAGMTAAAIRNALAHQDLDVASLDLLCCGTSTADQIKPGHASMVHGELGGRPLEVVSTAGVCGAGMSALKYAYLAVTAGLSRCAVSTGSELVSNFMRAKNFGGGVAAESKAKVDALKKHPELAFDKDFLRWMLSDGAGAAVLQPAPNKQHRSIRIDWIESSSFANEAPVCMYSGAQKAPDGRLVGWREAASLKQAMSDDYFAIKQDVKVLDKLIVALTVERALPAIIAKRRLKSQSIDWFLPHYSSMYFRGKLAQGLERIGFVLDERKWFSNLATVGNVGAGSIYLMLEEILYSEKLEKGQRLLCFVPESARFSVHYMHLTVV
jgi:3-oxoacyl-[acyl-carrier-protein] synthase III